MRQLMADCSQDVNPVSVEHEWRMQPDGDPTSLSTGTLVLHFLGKQQERLLDSQMPTQRRQIILRPLEPR